MQPELNLLPLSPNQHGFRPNHSTVSALLPLAHKITQGFNQSRPPLHTLTKITNLTKAFVIVNHTKLIHALTLSYLSNNTKHWLFAYLKGRIASCLYNFTLSSFYHVRVGVPQGTCVSPTLYNSILMTSLFLVPTPMLIRWLRPFYPFIKY